MKKQNRNEFVGARFTQREKRRIKLKAEKAGMNISDYVRDILLYGGNKEKDGTSKRIVTEVTVQAREISNYIIEKYGEDENLERKVKELWKSLS